MLMMYTRTDQRTDRARTFRGQLGYRGSRNA